MAEAAAGRGHDYIAITDHSRHVTVANGLDPERLASQIEAIDRLDEKLDGRFQVLKAVELDILEDGPLDLPRKRQTERILRAVDSPFFNILAHPSGRLIGERKPYEVDLERLIEAAVERGCFLELNTQPKRLDLTDADCRLAKSLGAKIAISTDAHSAGNLAYTRFGVDQAPLGWLEPEDVINTHPVEAPRKLLAR